MTLEIGPHLKDLIETVVITCAIAYAYITFLRG
jgi:hypothetical protein